MNWLARHWRISLWFAVTALVVVFYAVLFPARRAELAADSGLDAPVADAWLFYTSDRLADALPRFSQAGRLSYAKSEFTLDLAFPFLYGTSLFLALDALLNALLPPSSRWRVLRFGPVWMVLADLMENSLITANLLTYPPINSLLVNLAAWVSAVKWILGIACVLLLVLACLGTVLKAARRQQN